MGFKINLINILMNVLFYSSPKIAFSDREIDEFNRIFNAAINEEGLIEYTSQFPKQRFILYIANHKNVLLHGSNHNGITEFEPKDSVYDNEKPDLTAFNQLAEEISSNFFTMDIGKTVSGDWIVIEVGDGQVSGLPLGSDTEGFYKAIKDRVS